MNPSGKVNQKEPEEIESTELKLKQEPKELAEEFERIIKQKLNYKPHSNLTEKEIKRLRERYVQLNNESQQQQSKK